VTRARHDITIEMTRSFLVRELLPFWAPTLIAVYLSIHPHSGCLGIGDMSGCDDACACNSDH